MQAVLLVGGKGSRLRPYTAVFPKSLMPVGDLPILEVVVRQLKREGFTRLVFAVGHLHEMFRMFFGNGEKWGLDIRYSLEDQPLGTAGPLRCISDLDENFLMMNGDILTDLRYGELFQYHLAHGHPATIATHERQVRIDYGTLDFNSRDELVAYAEKPVLPYHVSMGIYVFSRTAVELIPPNQPVDVPVLMKSLMEHGKIVQCYRYGGYWLDIGRPEDYEIAIEDFERMREVLL